MSLHIETQGSGSPLLLIHGWSLHGGVWDKVVVPLAAHFQVHCVDLPGSGYSPPLAPTLNANGLDQLDALVDTLSARFSAPLNVCGWSIGGLVALRWARLVPLQVQRLVLVASTPCFTRRENWLYGMPLTSLQQFADELVRDRATLLRHFLALMVRGSIKEREVLSFLRWCQSSREKSDLTALESGLNILREVDLRAELPYILQPALIICGEHDPVTPPAASYYMQRTLPHARLCEFAGAAHTPFLSHPELFVSQLVDFLHE
jgi:pimeloyl-[acyl-carrier protein] methyl ester esterase